ncbi:peptidase S24 [Larkinella humicola]|uniref:Peptidase S24 n=1 Tax=Larkinella humicola TaxID=2607654 RepID=A0A5N1JAC6_9BACT|nr:peptidase S24 [Larkinella humicola]
MIADDLLIPDEIILLDSRGWDEQFLGFQPTTGFASPANQDFKRACDLNELVVTNRDATYYVEMTTDSMVGERIRAGDRLIVDASRKVVSGTLIMAWADGGYRIRRIQLLDHISVLHASHPDYPPIYCHEDGDFQFFGVVTFVFFPPYQPTQDEL